MQFNEVYVHEILSNYERLQMVTIQIIILLIFMCNISIQ